MTVVYTNVFKVPVWVMVNIDRENDSLVLDAFKECNARHIEWKASTFPITINKLSSKGWKHITEQPYPFMIDHNFIPIAINAHLQSSYGRSKSLSGTPTSPVKNLNRRINSGDDYVRLFNDVMNNEPDISLSKLFDIAENCFYNNTKFKVFITEGNVPKKLLQRIADCVITIGGEGSDIVFDGNIEETIDLSTKKVANILGI